MQLNKIPTDIPTEKLYFRVFLVAIMPHNQGVILKAKDFIQKYFCLAFSPICSLDNDYSDLTCLAHSTILCTPYHLWGLFNTLLLCFSPIFMFLTCESLSLALSYKHISHGSSLTTGLCACHSHLFPCCLSYIYERHSCAVRREKHHLKQPARNTHIHTTCLLETTRSRV